MTNRDLLDKLNAKREDAQKRLKYLKRRLRALDRSAPGAMRKGYEIGVQINNAEHTVRVITEMIEEEERG